MGHAFRLRETLRNSLATIPNALSLVRLVLGLVFPWIAPAWRLAALIVAAVTDLLDGWLSRMFHASSRTGRFLDPIADKVFVAGIALTLLWERELSVWEVLGIAGRDVVVVIGTIVLVLIGRWGAFERMAPTWLGKLTTAGQFAFFSILFIAPEYQLWLFVVVAGLSCCAGAQYLWQFFDLLFVRPATSKE